MSAWDLSRKHLEGFFWKNLFDTYTTWILALGYLHLLPCTCVTCTWILKLGYLHLLTCTGVKVTGDFTCDGHACRGRGMRVKLRFPRCARNPLRRSCVSRARNAGKLHLGGCPRNPRRSCASKARNAGKLRLGGCPRSPRRSCVEGAECRYMLPFVCFEGCLRARLMHVHSFSGTVCG